MDEYNRDHYVTPRVSGLQPHHFRRESDAHPIRHWLLVVVLSLLVAAVTVWWPS